MSRRWPTGEPGETSACHCCLWVVRALIAVTIVLLTNPVHAECPQAPRTVDELVAAAECFDRAADIDEAIRAYELVAFKNARSKHAMRALWRAAELLARVGRIER